MTLRLPCQSLDAEADRITFATPAAFLDQRAKKFARNFPMADRIAFQWHCRTSDVGNATRPYKDRLGFALASISIVVHHLCPCSCKVVKELLLAILRGVNFGNCAQFGVIAESQIDRSCIPPDLRI
jgi:hypothetical protein